METGVILLMRHAERSADPLEPNLSPAGFDRAKKLASYLPATFGKPDFLFASAVSKHSRRPLRLSRYQRSVALRSMRTSRIKIMELSLTKSAPRRSTMAGLSSFAGTTAISRHSRIHSKLRRVIIPTLGHATSLI
jgi:hypothetical protein